MAALPLVVVLTKGLLRDLSFAQVLLAARAGGAMLHPVLIERPFDFPGPETMAWASGAQCSSKLLAPLR